jgi:hypothetical protein
MEALVLEWIGQHKAMLFMGNSPIHIAVDVMRSITTAKVRVVTLPPHGPQIFLLFDLTLSWIFKREGTSCCLFDELTIGTFPSNVRVKLAKTPTDPNSLATFNATGVVFNTRAIACGVIFHPGK